MTLIFTQHEKHRKCMNTEFLSYKNMVDAQGKAKHYILKVFVFSFYLINITLISVPNTVTILYVGDCGICKW